MFRPAHFIFANIAIFGLVASYTVDPPSTAPADTIVDCTYWTVAASSDTCSSLADYGFLTLTQLYSYNPSLSATGCPIIVGDSYCLEQNFGVPPPVTTTTSSTTTQTTSTGNGVSTPTPTQTGMATNCNKFYRVVSGDSCSAIASSAGIALSDFYAWNPAVKTDCSLLFLDYYVCTGVIGGSTLTTVTTTTSSTTTGNGITTPTPTQSGMASNCNAFHKVASGDSCAAIASTFGITLANFYSWNPAVKTDCSLLFLDYYVCVNVVGGTTISSTPSTTTTSTTTTTTGNGITTPTPVQTGIASNCNTFHKVQSGDTCAAIASSNGISLSNFYTWNPAVQSDCSLLFLDYYVCVNIVGGTTTKAATTTTTSKATTTTGNGVTTPTPTQSVVSGDTCSVIASNAGISLANFYSWNPAVKTDCSLLYLDYYVCIARL